MRGLGVRIARGINAALERTGRVIGDRYHARALESPRATRNALVYVLLNSARHRGRSVHFDSASSGAVFDGWRIPPLPRSSSPPGDVADTVVAPAVWLLRRAWRRGGLIDPHAVPGALR
jgi:hypothetical protein